MNDRRRHELKAHSRQWLIDHVAELEAEVDQHRRDAIANDEWGQQHQARAAQLEAALRQLRQHADHLSPKGIRRDIDRALSPPEGKWTAKATIGEHGLTATDWKPSPPEDKP